MTADEIIAAARLELGTPFRHQGRIPGKALDCAGFLVSIAAVFDVPVIDRTDYARRPGGGMLEVMLDAQPSLERVKVELLPGLMFLVRFSGEPQHLGICTGATMIHAYQPSGKVCEHVIDSVWMRRIVRAYRFKDMS